MVTDISLSLVEPRASQSESFKSLLVNTVQRKPYREGKSYNQHFLLVTITVSSIAAATITFDADIVVEPSIAALDIVAPA